MRKKINFYKKLIFLIIDTSDKSSKINNQMSKIIVKFNNGTQSVFPYCEEKIDIKVLIKDIGIQLYPEKYNPKIDQYIKLIHMGKISSPDDEIIFDSANPDQTFHCVIKKIPDEAFIIEKSKTVNAEEVQSLISNPKFIELVTLRSVFELLSANLDSHEQLDNLISGKPISVSKESLVIKYSQQINILKEMGFTDENELAVILSNANGNLENVINILMN